MPKVGQPEIDQIGMLITAIHVLFIQIVNVRTDFGIHQMQCLMLQNISFVQKMFPFAKIKFLLMMQFFRHFACIPNEGFCKELCQSEMQLKKIKTCNIRYLISRTIECNILQILMQFLIYYNIFYFIILLLQLIKSFISSKTTIIWCVVVQVSTLDLQASF